jgi:hypothetical protein
MTHHNGRLARFGFPIRMKAGVGKPDAANVLRPKNTGQQPPACAPFRNRRLEADELALAGAIHYD